MPTGLDGAALQLLRLDGLALAASEHKEPLPPTRARLLCHRRVNLALRGVPFRYGQVAADRDDAERTLGPRAAELAASLEHVAGCVEFVVTPPDPAGGLAADGNHGPGTAYLHAARRRYLAADEVRVRVASAARDVREVAHGLACLVAYDRVDDFRRLAVGCSISGPWPPGSFV
ncbi:MAG: GvpL/GvpF family gas vesicle protein [Chloroflexi bacterium]|nr:GvpL/GvpF family gas vesicle protein [Chloroflexota bacterium]